MATIHKKYVSDGDKKWISASMRVHRYYEVAKHPFDLMNVDLRLLSAMIVPKDGSSESLRMVIDLFLQRENTGQLDPKGAVARLLQETQDVLRGELLCDEMLSFGAGDEQFSGEELAELIEPTAADAVDHLRAILAIKLDDTSFFYRPHSILTKLINHIASKALYGDEDASDLLRHLRRPFRRLLATLSCSNTLVSFIEPPLLHAAHPVFH